MAAGAGVPQQSDPLAGYGQPAAPQAATPQNAQYAQPSDAFGGSQPQPGQVQGQPQGPVPQYPQQQPPAGPGYGQGQSGQQQYPY